ncbi:hypothetical protein ACJDTP_13980 [Clostridium sp. WILCCON 0112]|uniref:Uncharacterized protein n=1 Tax=Candidatus Clostridium helianthi TaxID=3381660 RepID=A0ABW8S8H6_9CLOT
MQIFSIAFYNFQCYTSYKVPEYLIGSITFVAFRFCKFQIINWIIGVVIYLRWPQKCFLILAAISRQAPSIELEIADYGSLRKDLIVLLKVLDPIFEIIRTEDIRDVISNEGIK